eukprot:4202706-Amphidinium_carterae.1
MAGVCFKQKCGKALPTVYFRCRCGASFCSEACFVSLWHAEHQKGCPMAQEIDKEVLEKAGGPKGLLKKGTKLLSQTALTRVSASDAAVAEEAAPAASSSDVAEASAESQEAQQQLRAQLEAEAQQAQQELREQLQAALQELESKASEHTELQEQLAEAKKAAEAVRQLSSEHESKGE